jgi:hypothetical protein
MARLSEDAEVGQPVPVPRMGREVHARSEKSRRLPMEVGQHTTDMSHILKAKDKVHNPVTDDLVTHPADRAKAKNDYRVLGFGCTISGSIVWRLMCTERRMADWRALWMQRVNAERQSDSVPQPPFDQNQGQNAESRESVRVRPPLARWVCRHFLQLLFAKGGPLYPKEEYVNVRL